MTGIRAPLERILLTLWVGAIWAVGYVVAPTLFAMLERSAAGAVAGRLFATVNVIGFICGGVLLLMMLFLDRRPGWLRCWNMWFLAMMLVLTLINHAVVAPQMAAIKLVVGGAWIPGSELQQRFAALHRISTTLYVINSLLGLLLVIRWRGSRDGAEPR